MSTLLLTCFDPFGGESVNPSMELCARMPDVLKSFSIRKLVLPTSFQRAPKVLWDALDKISPDAVLCIGQAGGRAALSFEKIGVNWMQGSIADNDGFRPKGEYIKPGAPDGLFSTLPVEAMAQAACNSGIPANVSFTAGAFVCNCVLYNLLLGLKERGLSIPAGFLHVPYSTAQAAAKPSAPASMSLENMEEGLCAAIAYLEENL